LIEKVDLDQPLAFRDRALFELAYGAGLRVSEWLSIAVKDALLSEGIVRVFGKGSKERLVPIGRSAVGAVAVIRTGLNFFLSMEMKGERTVEKAETALAARSPSSACACSMC